MEASEIIKNIENNLKELKEICGAKRPERKGLAEKLVETAKNAYNNDSYFTNYAKVAIDHACEVVDEVFGKRFLNGLSVFKSDVKQALRESI